MTMEKIFNYFGVKDLQELLQYIEDNSNNEEVQALKESLAEVKRRMEGE